MLQPLNELKKVWKKWRKPSEIKDSREIRLKWRKEFSR